MPQSVFSYGKWSLNLLLVNSSIISASEYLWKVNVFLWETQHSWRTEDRDVEEYQQLQQTVTARVQRAKAADLALKEEILQLLASISSIRCQSPSKEINSYEIHTLELQGTIAVFTNWFGSSILLAFGRTENHKLFFFLRWMIPSSKVGENCEEHAEISCQEEHGGTWT